MRKLWEDHYIKHPTGSTAFKSIKFTEPSKTELYMRMLNVTSNIKEEYKEFIKGKPTSIRGTALN